MATLRSLAVFLTVLLACRPVAPAADQNEQTLPQSLTATEVRVLRLIADGHTNKEIAALLSTTEDAVKGQVRSILAKLGANDRTHAAMIGLKRGIIEL